MLPTLELNDVVCQFSQWWARDKYIDSAFVFRSVLDT